MQRIRLRHLFALIAAVIAGVVAFYLVPPPLPELTREEFMAEVRAGHVRRVEINDQETIFIDIEARGEFRTGFDKAKDAGLPDELRALGIEVWFSQSPLGI